MKAAETEDQIQEGSEVSLNFSLALADGNLIDSNFDSKPARFRIGDGSMLPGFEQVLIGLRPGQELETVIPAAQAFGAVNPKNHQRFAKDKFKHLLEDELLPAEVGSVVTFKDPAGFDLPGVVSDIGEDSIGVDFNHPLAGKDITFRVKIDAVLPPSVESVAIRL